MRDFVILQLQQLVSLEDRWCTSSHWPRVQQLLRQHFTDAQGISCHFPMAWPPCLLDIALYDFSIWDFHKYNIYYNKFYLSQIPRTAFETLLITIGDMLSSFNSTVLFNIYKIYLIFFKGIIAHISANFSLMCFFLLFFFNKF